MVNVRCIMYVLQCTTGNVRRRLLYDDNVCLIMYDGQRTTYNVRRAMYYVQCTTGNVRRRLLYSVQCTSCIIVNNVYNSWTPYLYRIYSTYYYPDRRIDYLLFSAHHKIQVNITHVTIYTWLYAHAHAHGYLPMVICMLKDYNCSYKPRQTYIQLLYLVHQGNRQVNAMQVAFYPVKTQIGIYSTLIF